MLLIATKRLCKFGQAYQAVSVLVCQSLSTQCTTVCTENSKISARFHSRECVWLCKLQYTLRSLTLIRDSIKLIQDMCRGV